jgi:hypothetical protein
MALLVRENQGNYLPAAGTLTSSSTVESVYTYIDSYNVTGDGTAIEISW